MWDRLGTDHKLVIAYGFFAFYQQQVTRHKLLLFMFFRTTSRRMLAPRLWTLDRFGIATKRLKIHKKLLMFDDFSRP